MNPGLVPIRLKGSGVAVGQARVLALREQRVTAQQGGSESIAFLHQ